MRLLLISCITILLITLTSAGQAAADESTLPIKLYLPIESDSLKQSVQRTQQVLSAAGSDDIEVVAVEYWQKYQGALRNGHFGIYLAAPHYAAWAMAEHNFTPILRLAEPLKYVIATHQSSTTIFEINDLDNERVCAQKPLNLDYLLVNRAFDKPLLSADIVSVMSVREEMLSADSPCTGFAISDHLFKQIDQLQPGAFIRLQQSKVYNNYVLIAHPQIPSTILAKLRASFGSSELRRTLAPVFNQFAKRTDLVEALRDDYPPDYRQPLENYWGN